MEGYCYRVGLYNDPFDDGFYWFFDTPSEAVDFAKTLAREDCAYADAVKIEFVLNGDEE